MTNTLLTALGDLDSLQAQMQAKMAAISRVPLVELLGTQQPAGSQCVVQMQLREYAIRLESTIIGERARRA